MVVVPQVPLPYSTALTVEINTAVEDFAGHHLQALYRSSFPGAGRRPFEEVQRKVSQLFIDGPLCSQKIPSLVGCDEEGAILGYYPVKKVISNPSINLPTLPSIY